MESLRISPMSPPLKKAEKALARLKKEREASANKKERSPASKAGKILAHTKWDSASSAQKQKYLRQLARARTAAKETMERKKKIKEIERKKAAREKKAKEREEARAKRQAPKIAKQKAQAEALKTVKIGKKTFRVVKGNPLDIFGPIFEDLRPIFLQKFHILRLNF